MLPLVGLTVALNASGAEQGCPWNFQLWNNEGVPVFQLGFKHQPVVTFDDNQLIVSNAYADVYSFDLSEMWKITYYLPSSVNEIDREATTIDFLGDNIVLHGLKNGDEITVFTVNGMQILDKKAENTGDCTLQLSGLAQGVYMINVNGKTFKIVKK